MRLIRRRLSLTALAACLALSLNNAAQAVPILEFEFLNSGQNVSATDPVTISGRITNSGDPITDAFASFFNFGPVPVQIFNQYIDTGLGLGHPSPLTLGTAESVAFDIVTYLPFPIGGNLGDPVLPGIYTLPSSVIQFEYTEIIFLPQPPFVDFVVSPVDLSNAGDFTWTVAPTPVPEPATIILFSSCLAGMLLRRKNLRRPFQL